MNFKGKNSWFKLDHRINLKDPQIKTGSRVPRAKNRISIEWKKTEIQLSG